MEPVYVPVPAGSNTEAAVVAADNIAAEEAAVAAVAAAAVAAADIAAVTVAEAGSAVEKADLENTRSGHPATGLQPDPATCFRNRRRIY